MILRASSRSTSELLQNAASDLIKRSERLGNEHKTPSGDLAQPHDLESANDWCPHAQDISERMVLDSQTTLDPERVTSSGLTLDEMQVLLQGLGIPGLVSVREACAHGVKYGLRSN